MGRVVGGGPAARLYAGPHFFTAFSFLDTTEPGELFEAATVFVPRWQVALSAGRTIAVANLMVEADAPLAALAERVWRAHQKFTRFEYRTDGAGNADGVGGTDGSGGTGVPPVGSESDRVEWHGRPARGFVHRERILRRYRQHSQQK